MSRARDLANLGDGIDATQITSGVFADARIQASNVTQHEGSIDALGTLAGLTIANGGNIGSASDTDAMSISSAGIVTKSVTVGFSGQGYRPEDTNGYVHLNQNLYCYSQYYNSGHFVNGSGSGSGEFTCPVAGVYWMFASVLIDNDAGTTELCKIAWLIENTERFIGYDRNRSTSSYEGMITTGGIYQCSAGDKIVLRATNGKIHTGSEGTMSIVLLG